MTASTRDDDDMPRDARLLAALRHAPDHDASPPRELSARILASAQAAARAARAAEPARDTLGSRLSAWLLRPHLAAAFGTLAVAGLVALIWSTQEPPAGAIERSPAAPPAAAVAPKLKELTAPALDRPDASRAAAPAAKALPKSRPPTTSAKVGEADRDVAGAKADPPAAPDTNSTAGVSAIAPVPAPAPAPAVPPPAAAPPAERRAVADQALAGSALGKASTPPVAQEAERGRLRQEIAAAPRASAQATDPLASLDALLQTAPPELRWRGQGSPLPHGKAQQRWWAALRDATRGRWARELAATEPPTAWLTLSIGERGVATLWLADGKLMLREGDALWSVPLTDAQRRDWQEAVSRW